MRNVLTAICASFILGFCNLLFDGDAAWHMSLYCDNMQLCVFIALAFHLTPKKQFMLRSVLIVFLSYSLSLTQLYLLPIISKYQHYYVFYYFTSFCLIPFYVFNQFKKYSFKSDKIEQDNIYFCFWKPKTGIAFLSSLFGAPFGGMSVWAGGYLYGFRWQRDYYVRERIGRRVVERGFVVVDTGIKNNSDAMNVLNSLLGTPAGKVRSKCIDVLMPLFRVIGPNYIPSFFERMPSRYYKKVKNGQRHTTC